MQYTDLDGSLRTVTVHAELSELTEGAANQIFYSPYEKQAKSDPGIGIFEMPDNPRILIIGNSFVNSSKIGHSLQAMGGAEWTTVSIGTLTVSGIVNEFPQYVEQMERGDYDAIFLCGLYSTSDATAMRESVVPACKESGTQLILFPAHNENNSVIEAAARDPYVKVLNWKAELDTLIGKWGVPYDALCRSDEYRHSEPLAGYVGAHMIYRAIFGELPPVREVYAQGDLYHTHVSEMLGDYIANPAWVEIDDSEITYLP